MATLLDIDKNFAKEKVNGEDYIFFDIKNEPFRTYGIFFDEELGEYCRMDKNVAEGTNEGVGVLNKNTSGGRVRFRTNAKKFVLRSNQRRFVISENLTMTAGTGFSVYADGVFHQSAMPPWNDGWKQKSMAKNPPNFGFDTLIEFDPNVEKEREITIYFPLYNGVDSLLIGLQEGDSLNAGDGYKYELPVVFFGSSTTQGASCSRPGNSYDAMLSRMLDFDYINLGFSGSGRAEGEMTEYLANLKCQVFVCDYDYNAHTAEFLEKTHLPLYRAFRKVQPDTPILFLSKADIERKPWIFEPKERRDVIYKTYQIALSEGDENVAFIDGATLFGDDVFRDCCTIDSVHPTDLGFARMAEKVYPVLKQMLEKSQVKK